MPFDSRLLVWQGRVPSWRQRVRRDAPCSVGRGDPPRVFGRAKYHSLRERVGHGVYCDAAAFDSVKKIVVLLMATMFRIIYRIGNWKAGNTCEVAMVAALVKNLRTSI
jgi:hypothetical protein